MLRRHKMEDRTLIKKSIDSTFASENDNISEPHKKIKTHLVRDKSIKNRCEGVNSFVRGPRPSLWEKSDS